MDADPNPVAPDATARRGAVALLVVALTTTGTAAYLWHELDALRDADHARERRELEGAAAERAVLRASLDAQRRSIEQLGATQATLEQELATLRGGGRAALARAEVLHLLRLANESLHLTRDPQRADAALAAADARLAELGDAPSAAVRAQLARERAALAALPRVDVPGIALTLQRIGGAIAHLPLRVRLGGAPEAGSAAGSAAAPAALPEGFWAGIGARLVALRDLLVKVKRASGPVEPLLAPEQEYFLRRNLELKLESARLAALQRDEVAFQGAVRGARDWLAVYFDSRHPAVNQAVADLEGLRRARLAPALPDISGSSALLVRSGAAPR